MEWNKNVASASMEVQGTLATKFQPFRDAVSFEIKDLIESPLQHVKVLCSMQNAHELITVELPIKDNLSAKDTLLMEYYLNLQEKDNFVL